MLGRVPLVSTASATTLVQWVEIVGPEHTAQIRAITTDSDCPSVIADGESFQMQTRAKPGSLFPSDGQSKVPNADFPVLVCQLKVSDKWTVVLLDNKPIPLPRLNPQRIAIFGDTGCRIERTKKASSLK